MHSLVYFVVMFITCFLAVFAMVVISSIHTLSEVFIVGGLGFVHVGGYVFHLVFDVFASLGRFL